MSYYERPSPEEYEMVIDDLEDQIEDLKKERWVDHNFNWNKIQPIRNLLDEMDDLNDSVYLPAYKINLKRIYETTTDEGIKKDASVKRLIARDK